MKINELFISEAFSSAYDIVDLPFSNGSIEKAFYTDSGKKYVISYLFEPFMRQAHKEFLMGQYPIYDNEFVEGLNSYLDVSFFLDDGTRSIGQTKYGYDPEKGGEYTVTNPDDNPMKIFSTVMTDLRQAVTKWNPDVITFEGERKLGSLYTAMIKRYLPGHYDYVYKDVGNVRKFLIFKIK